MQITLSAAEGFGNKERLQLVGKFCVRDGPPDAVLPGEAI
jgi:hypothetical protein